MEWQVGKKATKGLLHLLERKGDQDACRTDLFFNHAV